MRTFWVVALLCALIGCGKKETEYTGPIGEPPGYRFVRESDPVGTIIYERGVQWVGSDKEPTRLGKITKLRHIATDGPFKGQEVVSYQIDGASTESQDLASMFYDSGIRFVKE